MRILGRGVERVLAGRAVELADRRPGLHRVRDQAVVDEVDLGDVGGLGERGVGGRLIAQMPVEAGVVLGLLPHLRRAGLDRIGGGDDGRQFLIGDVEEGGGILCLVAGFGDDDGDLVADVAHLVRHQRRVRRLHHRRAVLAVDLPAAGQAAFLVGGVVGAGENGDDAGGLLGLALVDLLDGGVGMRRAHDVGVDLPRPVDVVRVVAAAGEEAEVFLAFDGRPDECHGALPYFRIACAPARMALTML